MTESTERLGQLFFEVFEPLPRQGPGSRASTVRALALCTALPSSPAVLDLGCGAGAQTLDLAELTTGSIVAVDIHPPNIERLRAALVERGLDERVRPLVGDIGRPQYAPESFDLIWSEGALYNIGIEQALRLYYRVLRPGGYFAFTEAVWRKRDPPPEVKEIFTQYAAMGWARDVLSKIEGSELCLVNHFALPDKDWWDDFYAPMESRIEELRDAYRDDAGSLVVLEEIAREPQIHRRHSDYYGYQFFVLRRD